ncbi:MAG: hypothetical protein FWF79_10300 [Defluviitaleaceae bacterium]|nr:hypothetical protein [Defluviitaleaceae bacterium]
MDFMALLVCILIAAAIAGGVMMFIRSKLKSVKAARAACNYTRDNSFGVTKSSDTFLFNNIVRIPRAQNNSTRRRR